MAPKTHFSGGAHTCIGAGMARMEGQMILAMLVKNFRFTVLNKDQVQPLPFVTLRFSEGLVMKLEPR